MYKSVDKQTKSALTKYEHHKPSQDQESDIHGLKKTIKRDRSQSSNDQIDGFELKFSTYDEAMDKGMDGFYYFYYRIDFGFRC
jgi:hypothetical protein